MKQINEQGNTGHNVANELVGEIKGHVKIIARDALTNAIKWEMQNKNLISYGIRDVLAELLLQQVLLPGARTITDLRVNSMQMGTSNATPNRLHTALQSVAAVTKVLAAPDIAKISDGVYTFTTTMTTGEGNGNTFTEVGLFCVDNTMLSRQVHSPFIKDNTLTIQYVWTYTFS